MITSTYYSYYNYNNEPTYDKDLLLAAGMLFLTDNWKLKINP